MYRFIFLFLSLAVLGCRGESRPAGFPKLYACSITVIQDGKPLAECSVSLTPLDPENKWSSGGVSDAVGITRPKTHGRFEGVPEGVYKVVVLKKKSEGERFEVPMTLTPKDIKTLQRRVKESSCRVFNLVDRRYASFKTTPLEIRIEPRGKNRFTLDVGKAVLHPVNPI